MKGQLHFWKNFLALLNRIYNKNPPADKTCEYMSKCQQKDFLLEIFLFVNKPGSPGSKHGKIT